MSNEQAAPETKGVTVKLLATVDLGPEIEGMAGRQLRMRLVTIEPGGVFGPIHDHKGRPGTVYILQGTITDHRDGVATDYGPGVGWPEDQEHHPLAREQRNDSGGGDLGRYRQARVSSRPSPLPPESDDVYSYQLRLADWAPYRGWLPFSRSDRRSSDTTCRWKAWGDQRALQGAHRHPGLRRDHRRRPARGPRLARRRRRRQRQDRLRHELPRQRRREVRRPGAVRQLRGDRRATSRPTSPPRASTSRRSRRRACSPSTTSASSAARWRRPASTTSRACSCGSAPRSTRSAPSASSSTPSRSSSRRSTTRSSSAPRSSASSSGSPTGASRRSSPARAASGTITRHGLEEYVADFVVVLNHLVTDETATRRLRIVKYRGSAHGTNEFSFLIDQRGISVLPDQLAGLCATRRRPSASPAGIARLDEMLGGEGFYRGSSVLVSGTAGHRQDQHRRLLRRRRLPARREGALLRLRGVAGADHAATCAPSASTSSKWVERACCASTPSARRTPASRCTSCG